MGNKFFKMLFGMMMFVAAAAFTGCTEDETEFVLPSLKVSTPTLEFAADAQDAQTVNIEANCDWTISTSDLAWATILVNGENTVSGSGNATLSVTVAELPDNMTLRQGVISFELTATISGTQTAWDTADATVTVIQKDANTNVPTEEVIVFFNNFDKESIGSTRPDSGWPYADQTDIYKNEEGLGAANVTYDTKSISVRGNSGSDSQYSDYKGSGQNNLFFGSSAHITIQNIAVDKLHYELSFGTERYLNDDKDKPEGNTFRHEEFEVTLSNDGNAWSAPLNYTFAAGVDPNGRWDLATSKFTLPEGTTTLYIRFVSKIASGHRLDDVKLIEGFGGGDVVKFEGSDTPGGPDGPVNPTPSGDAIWEETVGTADASEKPWVTDYTGWTATGVTYAGGPKTSIRSSGLANNGSGPNVVFFGTAPTDFIVNGIALTSAQTNLQLTFLASRSVNNNGEYDNSYNAANLVVALSKDGSTWTDITYTTTGGEERPFWVTATADFTLTEAVEKLYIRWTAKESSVYRLDDMKLATGNGGQQVKFDGSSTPVNPTPGESVTMTIPELVAACKGKTEQTVLNAEKDVVFEGVVVTDKDGGNWSSNNLAVMTEGATTAENGILLYGSGITNPGDASYNLAAGDKVKVTLKAGLARLYDYSGCYEITGSQSETWVVIEKTGTATVTPVEITPDQLASFQYMPVTLKNVTSPATAAAWSGTQTFTQNGTAFTVYTAKGAAWVNDQFKAGVTGDISGMVTLYKGAAQVAPRNAQDIADFTDGSTGGDNTGGDNTGGDNTGGDNTGGDNTGGEPAVGDAGLTADDIVAICGQMAETNVYKSFSYNGWTGWACNSNNTGLQLNNKRAAEKGTDAAHIKTPVFASNAKTVTIVATSASSGTRNIGIYAADTDISQELVSNATPIAESNDATGAQQHTFTVDLSGKNLTQFIIYTTKGALVINSVAVEFE